MSAIGSIPNLAIFLGGINHIYNNNQRSPRRRNFNTSLKSEHFFWILTLLRVHRNILTPTGNSHTCCLFFLCLRRFIPNNNTHFFFNVLSLLAWSSGAYSSNISTLDKTCYQTSCDGGSCHRNIPKQLIIHVFVTLSLTLALPKGLHVFGIWEMYLRSVRWGQNS